MDSKTRFGVLVALIIIAVGVSHWRLRAHISDRTAAAFHPRTTDAVDGAAEAAEGDHYKRMAEAAVTATDPGTRESALRYLVTMARSDDKVDPTLVDWARGELARQKATESPGLLGKQLELEVGDDTPSVERVGDDDPSVGRIEEPSSRESKDEVTNGARPPDQGLVDPFSK